LLLLSALQYDPEGFGEIPWDDFLEVLNNPEFVAEVDANKRDILLERAQERTTTAITFQDFVNVVSQSATSHHLSFIALSSFLLPSFLFLFLPLSFSLLHVFSPLFRPFVLSFSSLSSCSLLSPPFVSCFRISFLLFLYS
jgi:hypothetical protein